MHEDHAVPADALGHFFRAGRGGQRHDAACQSLAAAQDVRADTGPLRGEQRPGTAKARGDLVEDQQGPVLTAQTCHAAQIVGMIEPHAARALHQRL